MMTEVLFVAVKHWQLFEERFAFRRGGSGRCGIGLSNSSSYLLWVELHNVVEHGLTRLCLDVFIGERNDGCGGV